MDSSLPSIKPFQVKHTYIGRLILGMRDSLETLGAKPTDKQLELWAIFIHESMSISSRNYHSVHHVFDLADGWDDPIGVLSAFFHDCIYYHVDGGLSPCQANILNGVVDCQSNGQKLFIREQPVDDPLLLMVESIFGMTPGQEMSPTTGFNEFLSAVIAVRVLSSVLGMKHLAEIACCIEATIPFRTSKDDLTPMERLFTRMNKTNQTFSLGFTDDELVKAVQRAVSLANRDVGNFGTEDRMWFLDNTWSLLPETNESLRHQYLYTVKEFQHAVFKMNAFFLFLDPGTIFASFRGFPLDEELDRLTTQARRNLDIGKLYVSAKLLSVSVLAAFAELTGGDAPMSLFMGDLPFRHHISCRLEDYLPTPASLDGCDIDVYNILAHGRKTESSFDIRQSPLAAYLYSSLGDEMVIIVKEQTLHPMIKETAEALLMRLPHDSICILGDNLAKVAVSRASVIQDVVLAASQRPCTVQE